MKVFISHSAEFSTAIKKKLVVGNTFILNTLILEKPEPKRPSVGFITSEIRAEYAKKPAVVKIEKTEYFIAEVEETRTGTLKSITANRVRGTKSFTSMRSGYNPPAVLKLSAAKLVKLLDTRITKTDSKGTQSITLKSVTGSKSEKLAPSSVDSKIAKLRSQIQDLTNQLNALDKIKSAERAKIEAESNKRALDKLKADGYTYIQEIAGKRVKKRTLVEARNVNPGIGKSAAIYAVKDGKEQKILVWSAKDPITKRIFKGYMWWFTTNTAEKKFSAAV
jgi:hypothetical protein